MNYLKTNCADGDGPLVTAMIRSPENLEAARIAGEGRAEVLYFQDALSRIIAHTCRQPGLSRVLTEFFDFGGDEFYFEHFPELAGKAFGDALNLFERSTVVALEHDGRVMLNPPMDTVIAPQDRIVHLAEDDGASRPSRQLPEVDLSAEAASSGPDDENDRLLVLGVNPFLPDILKELDCYAAGGAVIRVAGPEVPPQLTGGRFEHIEVRGVTCDIYQRDVLEDLVRGETPAGAATLPASPSATSSPA